MSERPADEPDRDDVVFEQTELTGLNLFDDRASLAGSFPRSMWGYDRVTVDTHVREIEQQLTALKRLTRELRKQLREALSTTRESDFRRLGAHATNIVLAAENQARALVSRAESEAERIKEEGRRVAAELRRSAQVEIDDIRMAGLAHLRELRAEHERTVAQALASARADADSALEAARRHADAVTAEAATRAATILKDSQLGADSMLADASKRVAEQELEARSRVETMLTEARAVFDEARATSATLMAESAAQHERSATRLREETEQAEQLRSAAITDAEQARVDAARDAEAQIQAAHRQGNELLQSFEEQHAWRREQLEREIGALLQRKAAVVAQLANLRNLAHEAMSDFPDEDPFAEGGLAVEDTRPAPPVADAEPTVILDPATRRDRPAAPDAGE